ncbi:Probable 2-oxoglutarate-dependent dioxygenase AOP1.2 [Linum grandiflorum]
MSNKAATPPPSLPFIDLSKTDLNPNSWEWEVLKSQVYLSLKDFGCFKARFPELQLKAAKAMIAELKQLFDLPLDIKLLNTSDMPFGGFIGQSTFAPLYQSFGIEDPFSLPKLQSLTHALLPDKPSLRLCKVEETIRRMVVESLGIDKYIEEHLRSSFDTLRFMKYDGININMNENEPKFGLNSHMDQDLMTVLYSNYAGELEILTKDGQYWISSQATSQDFIVFVGESLHAWTNGRLHCPYHRVKMTGREARYSVAVFTAFKGGYTVEAPEELVDEEHPLLYKPFDHLDFLNLMDRDAGKAYFGDQLNAYTPLKAYYGIFN